jgi:hypothetical protein
MLWIFLPEKSDGFDRFLFTFVRIVYFVVLVLDEGRHAVDFSSRKNPTASVGSELAILGTRGQHANH